MQSVDAFLGDAMQVIEVAEENRSGGTCFGARRLHTDLLAVVAERALEGPPVVGTAIDHAEWTGHHAIPASIADVGLHVNAAEFSPDDRSGRTGFQTPGVFAMLADVG